MKLLARFHIQVEMLVPIALVCDAFVVAGATRAAAEGYMWRTSPTPPPLTNDL